MTDRKFDRNSWLVLLLALAILAYSYSAILWQASLPADGWSYLIDLANPDEALVVESEVGHWSSPLQAGDMGWQWKASRPR
jgi:hypothetical protein